MEQGFPSGKRKPGLRILHVITDLRPGGSQDNTILNANAQAASGFSVAVAAGPFRSRHSSLSGVRYFPLRSLRRSISPWHDLRAALEFREVIAEWRPDVIHTHLSKAGLLARLIAPRSALIVHTIHTFPFHPGQNRLAYAFCVALERYLASRTDLFLAVAQNNVRKSLAHQIGRSEQYRVVPSGLEIAPLVAARAESTSDLRREFRLPHEATVIGTVARLVPQKNPLCFVEAAAQLSRLRPDLFFCIVGDGPLRAGAEARARDLGITNIRFAGEQADGYRWIRSFDVFVHTSRYEGMGRVLGEAMVVGTPVVATAVDGVVDAIGENGERGLLVPPDDPDAIAGSVLRLASDPELRTLMAERARLWAESNLSATQMVSETIAAYMNSRTVDSDSRN